ncbi:MAG: FAD:protein FMN transferase [Bradyrhizobium sp.]
MRRVAIPREISYGAAHPPRGGVRTLSGLTMGTTWRVTYVSEHDRNDRLRERIEQVLDTVIAQMSTWEPCSDISRINRSPLGEWCSIRPELRDVLACGLAVQHATGGAFDVSVGTSVDLWGFGPPGAIDRPPARIDTARSDRSLSPIELDADDMRVRRNADVRLDLSGIAKGHAVDLVLGTMRQVGHADCLVEIGGELAGAGVKPDGSPWWVEIAGHADDEPVVVALHGMAIATSGIERHLVLDGQTYSHTIDPATGAPIANEMVQCSVVASSCMLADAYATALMVKGPCEWADISDAENIAAVMRHRASGQILETITPDMKRLLE